MDRRRRTPRTRRMGAPPRRAAGPGRCCRRAVAPARTARAGLGTKGPAGPDPERRNEDDGGESARDQDQVLRPRYGLDEENDEAELARYRKPAEIAGERPVSPPHLNVNRV